MGFYVRYHDPEARREVIRYYNFLAKHDALYRANRSWAEVLLLFPRSRVHEGNVEAVDAFRDLGKKLLDQHVLFDVIPDDVVTENQKAKYRTVVDFRGKENLPKDLSTFKAPTTVRVSASEPKKGGGITLHFVNYNRREPAKKRSAGGGIKDEKPIAVKGIEVDFELPKGSRVAKVKFSTPESPAGIELKHRVEKGRLRFVVPELLVYGIAHVQFTTP